MLSRLQSWMSYLTSDPLGFIVYALYLTATVLLSLILHECAHGYVAYRCGDPTAKWMGRLTLDPRKHLDPFGTICMFLLGFGWARPVPVNSRNFKNYRRDDFLVSIAGIVTNLTLFVFCVALSVGINGLMWDRSFLTDFHRVNGSLEALISPYWTIGNGIMNGNLSAQWTRYMTAPWLRYVQRFLLMMAQINLSLAIFNILPIPPLDGYHLVNDTLLKGKLQLDHQTFRIAQIVLMVVCLTGVLGTLLSKANMAVYEAVLRLFLLISGGA